VTHTSFYIETSPLTKRVGRWIGVAGVAVLE